MISTGRLNQLLASRFAHEIRESPVSDVVRPSIVNVGVALPSDSEPAGDPARLAELVEDVRPAPYWPAPELLDERDALLQLRLARLELLHLREDGPRAAALLISAARDLLVEPDPRLRSDQNHQPTRDDGRRAGSARAPIVTRCAAVTPPRARLLASRAALDRQEVDANHRSPTRRSARPDRDRRGRRDRRRPARS